MVQNWENFMDPGGGAYDTSFATGGASILAGFGIDLAARTWVDGFTKIDPKNVTRLKTRYSSTLRRGSSNNFSSQYKLPGGTTINIDDLTTTKYKMTGTDYYGNPVGEKVKGGNLVGKEIKKDFDKYKNQVQGRLQKKYGGTSTLLKGLSWTLLATGAMMMIEGATTPGTVSRAAMLSDQRAMGMIQGPMDSQQAYTQRQRALMAIHDSQLGIRNVIGNEAGHLHR